MAFVATAALVFSGVFSAPAFAEELPPVDTSTQQSAEETVIEQPADPIVDPVVEEVTPDPEPAPPAPVQEVVPPPAPVAPPVETQQPAGNDEGDTVAENTDTVETTDGQTDSTQESGETNEGSDESAEEPETAEETPTAEAPPLGEREFAISNINPENGAEVSGPVTVSFDYEAITDPALWGFDDGTTRITFYLRDTSGPEPVFIDGGQVTVTDDMPSGSYSKTYNLEPSTYTYYIEVFEEQGCGDCNNNVPADSVTFTVIDEPEQPVVVVAPEPTITNATGYTVTFSLTGGSNWNDGGLYWRNTKEGEDEFYGAGNMKLTPGQTSVTITTRELPGNYEFYVGVNLINETNEGGDQSEFVNIVLPVENPEQPVYTTNTNFGDAKCVDGEGVALVTFTSDDPGIQSVVVSYFVEGVNTVIEGELEDGSFVATVPLDPEKETIVNAVYDAGFRNDDGSIQFVGAGDRDYPAFSCATDPVDPVDPEQPVDPEVPVNPEQPEQPSAPEENEHPEETAVLTPVKGQSTSAPAKELAVTGADNSSAVGVFGLGGLLLLAGAVLVAFRRRLALNN